MSEGLRGALLELVPDERRVSTSAATLEGHAGDLTAHATHEPDAVVFPETTAEVARVLAYAHEARVPVVAYGAGSSLEGHVIPVRGGITLDLTRMDRVLAVRPDDLTATVQPGLMRSGLNAAAGEHGLFFPVDPGADASLGGMAATNASGTTTIRYGGMRPQVLALEVVLADGRIVRTGSRASKSSAGYHLTGLYVGSEGTLGVITELTLRLYGIPEAIVAARAVFPDLEAACRAAASMVAAGVAVARLELVDERTLRFVNAHKGTAYAEAPSLFVELAGSEAGLPGEIEAVREIADGEGCTSFVSEADAAARARLWEARHDALWARLASEPGKRHTSTDVCVPVSELAGAVGYARSVLAELGRDASIVAHACDGNYHVASMLDPDDPAEVAAVLDLNERLIDDALARGGTCSGEHGIGLGKIGYLEREHGDLLPLMRGIKELFDPHGILNPGKVLRPETEGDEPEAERVGGLAPR